MIDIELHRGDIWWYQDDGAYTKDGTYTSEQTGVRPCVVVSNEMANTHSRVISVIPLTTAWKKYLPTHAIVKSTKRTSVALCEQIYSISKDRLIDKVGSCTEKEMLRIDKCIRIQLDL